MITDRTRTVAASDSKKIAPITAKQIAFMTKLMHEAYEIEGLVFTTEAHDNFIEIWQTMDVRQASKLISNQIDANRRRRALKGKTGTGSPATVSVVEEGFYRFGKTVAKVRVSGTGNFYAMTLSDVTWKFEYAPGVVRKLSASDKLTVEEAAKLGHHFGHCMMCGYELTNPKSVERGMGPSCAKKYF